MIKTEDIKNNMKVISIRYGVGVTQSFRISENNRAYAVVKFKTGTYEMALSQLSKIKE